jgi:N-acetylmuramoyl-L-alanine amidase
MMKKIKTCLVISFAAGCLLMLSQSVVAQKNVIRTVIIDPGHGGIDPGARGLFSTEAEVALSISLKLGAALEKEFPNIKFVYTRTTDVLPGGATNVRQGLVNRANMANDLKGDLFIAIHLNATGQKAGGWYAKKIVGYKPKVVYTGSGKRRRKKHIQEPIYESYYVKNTRVGTETYIWAADRSDEKSENVVVGGEEGGEDDPVDDPNNILDLNSPEAKIRAQLYTKYFFRNSALLASMVEDEFSKSGRSSFGVKQRNNKGIWVLQATGMPSILVETGFITNKEEEEYLNSEKGQEEIVENISGAFRRYKQELEASKHNTHAAAGK